MSLKNLAPKTKGILALSATGAIAVIAIIDDVFPTPVKGEESVDITRHAVAHDEKTIFLCELMEEIFIGKVAMLPFRVDQ